jgi:hypothetical protein
MAGSFSDYAERALLRQLFRNTAGPQPANVYVALFTASPTDANSGTEVTGGSYARVAVSTGTSGSGAGSGWADPGASGAISTNNNAAITFPTPSANWGTVTQMGIYDAATVGNLLAWADLTTSRTINNGDSAPSFAISALSISLD